MIISEINYSFHEEWKKFKSAEFICNLRRKKNGVELQRWINLFISMKILFTSKERIPWNILAIRNLLNSLWTSKFFLFLEYKSAFEMWYCKLNYIWQKAGRKITRTANWKVTRNQKVRILRSKYLKKNKEGSCRLFYSSGKKVGIKQKKLMHYSCLLTFQIIFPVLVNVSIFLVRRSFIVRHTFIFFPSWFLENIKMYLFYFKVY